MVGVGEAWAQDGPENIQRRVLKHKASLFHVVSLCLSLHSLREHPHPPTPPAWRDVLRNGAAVGEQRDAPWDGNMVSVGRVGGIHANAVRAGFRRGLVTPTFTAAWFLKVKVWTPPEGPWMGVEVNSRRLSLSLNKEVSSPHTPPWMT